MTPEQIIESLRPQVTEERWQKILKVVDNRNKFLATVVENIYDRGNASAVMRSCEAFGYYQFHHIELHDKFKESKRVTQGADKWLVQEKWPSTEEGIQALKQKGFQIYVTHLEGGIPIHQASFEQPVALCFGNELKGASEVLTDLADQRIFIPMKGFVQSFNISVAAALCYQHIRREHDRMGLGDLSQGEKNDLIALYLKRTLKNAQSRL